MLAFLIDAKHLLVFNYTHTLCFLIAKSHAIVAFSAKVFLSNTTPSLLPSKYSNYILSGHENTAITSVSWTDSLAVIFWNIHFFPTVS